MKRWLAFLVACAVLSLAVPPGSPGPLVAAGAGGDARTGAGAARGSESGDSALPREPVVLVHGMTAGGPGVWGERTERGHGLYGRLIRAGYVPGRTLFTYDYGGALGLDYTGLARLGLDPIVRRAGEATGRDRVDIVTFGSGALIARYWVASRAPGAAPSLRNLVMIAPPNHGQFQVDLIKTYYHTDRLVHTPGSLVTASGSSSPAGSLPDPAADEAEYVATRTPFYQARYADYLIESRLLGSSPTTPPRWEEWLSSTRAETIEEFIFRAQHPSTASAGSGLTRAYYEVLAIRVGRLLYLAHAVRPGNLPPLPSLDDLVRGDLRRTIIDYLKDLLLDWGLAQGEALWKRERSGAAVHLGELLSGFGVGSPAFDRLTPEYVDFPRPGTARRETVLANWFLQGWQAREAALRPVDSRYSTVAGSFPNLLRLAGLGLGENDLVVEVSSTLTDPHPPDSFHRRTGLLSFHRGLGRDGEVGALVLDLLGRSATDSGAHLAADGTGLAGLWSPVYRGLPLLGQEQVVTVRMADPATAGGTGGRDLQAQAWLAREPVTPGGVPCAVTFFELTPEGEGNGILTGTVVTNQSAGSVRLGVRLVPDPAAGPAHLTMARQLDRETRIPFSYSVTPYTRGDSVTSSGSGLPAEPELPASPPLPTGSSDEPGGEPPAATGSQAGSTDETPEELEEGTGQKTDSLENAEPSETGRPIEVVPTPDPPPLVNVILVTKMTTTKREKRTYHARWDWDFGDGERHSDENPSHTTVTVDHTYRAPGTYNVTAVSTANDGRLLRELTWTVEADAGTIHSFTAETIVEPEVVITLEGPAKWVTGRPARFMVRAEVSWPPNTRRQVIQAYPGWQFDVVWEKPGSFEVRAAVTVRQSYEFPERRLTIFNTYVKVVTIEIFIPGLTE